MGRPRGNRKNSRISVSFDDHVYAALSLLARQEDVSVAWLVRRAVHQLIESRQENAEPALPFRGQIAGHRGGGS